MKRASLVLDEQVLEDATREFGLKTYSATVNYALRELLRIRRVDGLADFFGSNIWEGDRSRIRENRPVRKPPRRR
jgi:Arc/MetJ family transcription regulator